MVSDAAETRAMRRFPSHAREELVTTTEFTTVRTKTSGEVEDALMAPGIGYLHAAMIQCFLPQKPSVNRAYRTKHGRASLMIEAGHIANPNDPGEWIECQLPAGPKPRLILPYIVGETIRNASPEIDLGRSLRTFMHRLGMPIAGKNGKALTEQIQNIAAAQIVIGQWTDDAVHTLGGRLAKQLSFWLERDPNQRTLWTPYMTLSDEFFQAVQHHRVPIDITHLAQLARSARRMDLYAWLSYRTTRITPGKREALRNLSTTLRQRRFRFTEQAVVSWSRPAG